MHPQNRFKGCLQPEKECIAREPNLKKYIALVRRMENYFRGFTIN
jgi:hypothetical protein